MAAYPESLLQADLRPVATLVGDPNVLDQIRGHLQTGAHERRLDFVIVEFSHMFDVKHEGKSFEKYTPEGILKLAWTTKCKDMSPATLGIFFNWGIGPVFTPPTEGLDWKTKEGAVIREVRKFRERTQGRSLKMCVVLILSQAELNDPSLEEKSMSLRKACELDSKALFVISDDLSAMVFHFQRIEKCLFEGAMNHYKEEIERLKKMKARAQREAQGYLELQVRYNFKLGYYTELHLEKEIALAYYKRAYQNLQEMPWQTSQQLEEIRTVSDWTVLRMYQIFLSAPYSEDKMMEAIGYFQRHFQKYREHAEVREELLGFLMGYFGKLLEQIPSEFYKISDQWTLPGFYFFNASLFESERRKATQAPDFRSNFANWQDFMVSNDLHVKDSLFVGQPRSIAQHPLQLTITEGLSDKTQMLMTKCLEEGENKYEQNIDAYLNSAWTFYRSQKNLQRTLCHVSKALANSYRDQGNLDMAIRFTEGALKLYKADGWTSIVKELCVNLIACHSALGQQDQAIMYMLEVIKYDKADSLSRYTELLRTIETRAVETDFLCTLISAKVKLHPKTLYKFEEATVKVTLTSHFPTTVSFNSVLMFFNDLNLNQPLADNLILAPEQPITLERVLILKSNLINTLELLKLSFDWRPAAAAKVSLVLARANPLAKAAINQPESQIEMEIDRGPPALIGEYHDLSLVLKPKSQLLKVLLFVEDESKGGDKGTRKASIDHESSVRYRLFVDESEYTSQGIVFTDLSAPQPIHMKLLFYEEGICSLKFRVRYHVRKRLSEEFEYKNELLYPLDIPVAAPFATKCAWNYPQPYFQHVAEVSNLSCLPRGRVCDLACTFSYQFSDPALTIYKVHFEPKQGHAEAVGDDEIWANGETGVTLTKDEAFSCMFQVIPKLANDCAHLGDLIVKWSRVGGSLANCRVPLSSVCIVEQPYLAHVSYPSEVVLDQTFIYKISLQNLSTQSLVFTLHMIGQVPAHFLWGGYEVMKLKLEKESDEEVEYVMLPVETGVLQLPRLEISIQREDKKEFTELDACRAIVVLP